MRSSPAVLREGHFHLFSWFTAAKTTFTQSEFLDQCNTRQRHSIIYLTSLKIHTDAQRQYSRDLKMAASGSFEAPKSMFCDPHLSMKVQCLLSNIFCMYTLHFSACLMLKTMHLLLTLDRVIRQVLGDTC